MCAGCVELCLFCADYMFWRIYLIGIIAGYGTRSQVYVLFGPLGFLKLHSRLSPCSMIAEELFHQLVHSVRHCCWWEVPHFNSKVPKGDAVGLPNALPDPALSPEKIRSSTNHLNMTHCKPASFVVFCLLTDLRFVKLLYFAVAYRLGKL